MSQAILDVLAKSETFTGVSREGLAIVATDPNVKFVSMKRGTYIYHAGEPADGFWLIVSGRILAETGHVREPFRAVGYNLGAVTGLKGLLTPGVPRPVSMVADGDVELLWIPGGLVRTMPLVDVARVMENVAKILLDKLRKCRAS